MLDIPDVRLGPDPALSRASIVPSPGSQHRTASTDGAPGSGQSRCCAGRNGHLPGRVHDGPLPGGVGRGRRCRARWPLDHWSSLWRQQEPDGTAWPDGSPIRPRTGLAAAPGLSRGPSRSAAPGHPCRRVPTGRAHVAARDAPRPAGGSCSERAHALRVIRRSRQLTSRCWGPRSPLPGSGSTGRDHDAPGVRCRCGARWDRGRHARSEPEAARGWMSFGAAASALVSIVASNG